MAEKSIPITQCRHFSGYKPCGRNAICSSDCESKEIVQTSILIVHLGALGAVVRATSLLKPIKRKFPSSRITWVTDKPADQILNGHPLIDRVLTTNDSDLLSLGALQFDFGFVIDKSLKAAGVLNRTFVDMVYGFRVDARSGAIIPATSAAEELWQIGLNDHLKFFVNKKPETQLMTEALELSYLRDDYHLPLTEAEQLEVQKRRAIWSEGREGRIFVGLNTGCSHVIPHKKLSIQMHRQLITELQKDSRIEVVLLGGPEDIQRNQQIAEGLSVHRSPEDKGLRDGYVSVAAMDIVITGDSLGMHLAIAAQKYVVAWFGPTCAHEIDLYDRGQALLTKAPCAPCWKRTCQKSLMCYDQVDITEIMGAVQAGLPKGTYFEESKPHHSDSFSW